MSTIRWASNGSDVWRAGGGDDVGPEREVRHELAVHHVPLDAVDAGRLERGDLLAEAGEVGGQHAGGDLDPGHGSRVLRAPRTRASVGSVS